MSEMKAVLSQDDVIAGMPAQCGREILSCLARHASERTGIDAQEILDTLMERERLGSTGIGRGIAIPHGKLQGLDKMVGILARLDQPVDFDAVDGQPVDLFFLLLAPLDASALHLKTLSRIARTLRNAETCEALRGASSAEAMYAILTADEQTAAA